MQIKINDIEYEIISNYKDAIDEELLKEKITSYFDNFSYIVGDWAYGKLRLKGFLDDNNPLAKQYNMISNLNDYLKDNCAYGCRWFCIKKKN